MFVNEMPRYEILSEEAMDTLDKGWRRIVVSSERSRAGSTIVREVSGSSGPSSEVRTAS